MNQQTTLSTDRPTPEPATRQPVLFRAKVLVQTRRKEVVRFLKFMAVGAFGAVVDWCVYNGLIAVVHPPAPWNEWVPEAATVVALATAIVSNFIWNRYWTYPDSRSKPVLKQFAQFFFINILAVVIRVPIVALTRRPFGHLVEQVLALDAEAATRLGYNLSWALGVGVAMFWNFFVNRIWTYSDVE
jgi:putative flippase GtrA